MCRPRLAGSAVLLASFLAAGCIKRTAPVATGPGRTTGGAVDGTSAALEAKNARLSGRPRTDLLGPAGLAAFRLQGTDAAKVELTTIPVEGMPFDRALRAEVKEETGHEWAVQLQAPTAAAVEEGDAILATFHVRAEAPQPDGVGETRFVFELARSPFTKSVAYGVHAGPEWSRVQVRFQAAASYPAGDAQLLFRLGYEPQILQLGGVKVESFGKAVPLGALPATRALDRRRERALVAALEERRAAPPGPRPGGALHLEVTPGRVLRPISPYVYGISSQPPSDTGATVRRAGGNRQTAYNWELDASNAGHDYEHSSDLWACTALGFKDCGRPAAQYLGFARGNRAAGIESIVTVPMVDYVVADHAGPVPPGEVAPSRRWNRSLPKKPSAFAPMPDLTDGVVYQDELVAFLARALGPAQGGGIRFYALDNEPALWPVTHPRVHPAQTRYAEVVARTEATAAAITAVDPGALTLGGSMFGWSELMSLAEAPDAEEHNPTYGTYLDYFLAKMKQLEATHGRRLLHVLDVHWYPEARGAKRITEKDLSPNTVAARLQAPRSLWDPTYTEKSWIASQWGKPIRLVPWLFERIDERYPGTKLAITEYNYGAGDHLSGGLAQVDVLGVLGREGVYLANYWGDGAGNDELPPYIRAAFQLYRNHDGQRGSFGDLAVAASTRSAEQASVFAATDSRRPGRLTVIVVNKDPHASFDGQLDLREGGYGKADVYRLDGSGPRVRSLGSVDIEGDRVEYLLPPHSATLFVCTR